MSVACSGVLHSPRSLISGSDVTSEQSVITLSVYDRSLSEHAFLGTVQIKPALVHDHTVDQWYK